MNDLKNVSIQKFTRKLMHIRGTAKQLQAVVLHDVGTSLDNYLLS